LHVHGRGAMTDACGHSFAVWSTLVSTVGLRLRLVVLSTMLPAVTGHSSAVLSTQVSPAVGLRLG
jgi:hypothetical protein